MEGIILGLLIPFMGTMLGSAFVFFMKKEMPSLLQKALLGFASGVMVAASVWSLLIPSMDMCSHMDKWSVMPAAVGFIAGVCFYWQSTISRLISTLANQSLKVRAAISHVQQCCHLPLQFIIFLKAWL